MNTLLLEHLAAVSKIAAYRQAREHQEGVDASNGYLISTDAGLRFGGPRTFEIFFRYEFVDHLQYLGGFQSPTISVTIPYNDRERDLLYLYCGSTYVWVPIVPGNYYHAVISYDGSESVCYLNGVEVGRKSFEGDVASLQFRIGAQSSPPEGPVYFCRHYNYALSPKEVSALWNNGDPAGYVLPLTMKRPRMAFPIDVYTPSNAVFNVVSHSTTTPLYDQPRANGFSGDYMRFNGISRLSLYCRYMVGYVKRPVPIKITFEYRSSTAIYSSQIDPSTASSDIQKVADANDGNPIVASIVYGSGSSYYLFSAENTPDAWLEMRILSIESIGCVAEYLPQNLVVTGPGERAPVEITGNGSYTWTGVGDTMYSVRIGTSRNPVLGQWYLIKGSVSNYEAGTPYISADTGYTEFALPRENSEFQVFAQCRSTAPSSYYFNFRGGNKDTDRRLTVTIESIAPVNNIPSVWLDSAKQLPLNDEYLPPLLETAGGYDLTTNRTPEIIYK